MRKYKPEHIDNKMENEGDVELARKIYLKNKINNLNFIDKEIDALNIDLPYNSVDVFDENVIANEIKNPWFANCAIPELLFQNKELFEMKMSFDIIKNSLNEFLLLSLSGGVIAKSKTIEMPITLLKIIDFIDKAFILLFPKIFAFGRSVVLKKRA